MSDWPQGPLPYPPLTIISMMTPHSVGALAGAFGTITGSTHPAANRALFVPFRLSAPFLAKRIFWLNGNTSTGNLDAGIYTPDGVRLASIGSTAQGTANSLQAVNFGTPVQLGPGLFYFALNGSSTTTAIIGQLPNDLPIAESIGILQNAVGAITLPATVTYAACSTARCPWVGISQSTSLP